METTYEMNVQSKLPHFHLLIRLGNISRHKKKELNEDEFNQSWEQWLQEAVDTHLQVTFDKYWLWVIHLPSGWPTHVEIMTETKVTSDDEEIKTVSDYRLVFERLFQEILKEPFHLPDNAFAVGGIVLVAPWNGTEPDGLPGIAVKD